MLSNRQELKKKYPDNKNKTKITNKEKNPLTDPPLY